MLRVSSVQVGGTRGACCWFQQNRTRTLNVTSVGWCQLYSKSPSTLAGGSSVQRCHWVHPQGCKREIWARESLSPLADLQLHLNRLIAKKQTPPFGCLRETHPLGLTAEGCKEPSSPAPHERRSPLVVTSASSDFSWRAPGTASVLGGALLREPTKELRATR